MLSYAWTECVYELSFDMKMYVCYQKGGVMFDQIDFKVCIQIMNSQLHARVVVLSAGESN